MDNSYFKYDGDIYLRVGITFFAFHGPTQDSPSLCVCGVPLKYYKSNREANKSLGQHYFRIEDIEEIEDLAIIEMLNILYD